MREEFAMVLLRKAKYLEDDAAVQIRQRRSWLLNWMSNLVENIVERATDDFFAAAEDQMSELKNELDDAGVLGTMPIQFGGGKSVPEYGFRAKSSGGKMNKKAKKKKSKTKTQQTTKESGQTTANSVPIDLAIGIECICFFSGDNLWYPAVIQEISDDHEWVVVSFVGYGNTETIPRTWIQPQPINESKDASPLLNDNKNIVENIVHDTTSLKIEENTLTAISSVERIECEGEVLIQDEPKSPSSLSSTIKPQNSRKRRTCPSASWSGLDAPNPNPMVDDKYWAQRYRLFSRYDEGLQIDEESWYSATPEVISQHIAERCRCDVILDPFCGVGGNVIQLAFTCHRVIAIDIDPLKILKAKHNALIYGVADRIEFIVGDSLLIMKLMAESDSNHMVDIVYLSPPWGGPSYLNHDTFDIESMIHINEQCNGYDLFHLARNVSKNVAYFLPRNISPEQLGQLADQNELCEVEDHVLNNKLKTRIAYYGELPSP